MKLLNRVRPNGTPFVAFALFLFFAMASAGADTTPTLSNLNRGQADAIIRNFSNAIAFRSVEPSSANGKIWGFGLGVLISGTTAGGINSALGLTGTNELAGLPAADIVVTMQAPYGISWEVGFLPRMTLRNFSIRRTGFNVKWTFTEIMRPERIPFDAMLRMGYGKNEFSYEQVVSSVNDRVTFKSEALRIEAGMSKQLLVFEPYIALGMLYTDSVLANTASAPLYNFTSSEAYDYSKSSVLFHIGTEVRLVFITAGAQVEWAFGETTATAKLGFKF